MFASVEVKDYTIELDGKPTVIKKERWLGVINRKDGLVTDEDHYFEGSVFDYDEETDSYSMGGSVTKTKAEFDAEAARICFLNEAEMKKNNKDMFERFRDKELPPDIQAHVESSANIHGKGNKNKWWFTAGFFVAQNIKEIRKKMGIDD